MGLKAATTSEVQHALGCREGELQELRDRVSSLCRDLHRFKLGCDRAKERRSQAVKKAIARVEEHCESAETTKVKRPDGRIEDWVRDLVIELVALDGVPTASIPTGFGGASPGRDTFFPPYFSSPIPK